MDGLNPEGGLVQAANGNFYGTTYDGGSGPYGTVFEMTSAGTLTTLYTFCARTRCADGRYPAAALVQDTNGNFYGTTSSGGNQTRLAGTVFKITPAGKLTTLHPFCVLTNCNDGAFPYGGLVQATDGKFYGTTYDGGTYGYGTIFTLDLKIAPFVKTLPTSGKVGGAVIILGSSLTDATGVTFNGTAAAFTLVSSSEITTTVPVGATTGTVKVTTPSGTLKSNVTFRVIPQ